MYGSGWVVQDRDLHCLLAGRSGMLPPRPAKKAQQTKYRMGEMNYPPA